MNKEHNFWVQMFLKDKSNLLGFKWQLQPESSLLKSCANHWKTPNWNAYQYPFHQNPRRAAEFLLLPLYWLASFHQVSCVHKLLSHGGDGKQKWIVIFVPCAVLQNLFPILRISCDRRGEHCFANGMILLNAVTEALQNKDQQLVNLWLSVHYHWTK